MAFFFFVKEKTGYRFGNYELSSDVCSSDLAASRKWRVAVISGRSFLVPVAGHRHPRRIGVSPGQRQEQTHADRQRDEGGAAIADEGQGHALRRKELGVHRHIDDRLSPELRSEEHTSELQSIMRISYAVFCL